MLTGHRPFNLNGSFESLIGINSIEGPRIPAAAGGGASWTLN
jgi:hypothetical protein